MEASSTAKLPSEQEVRLFADWLQQAAAMHIDNTMQGRSPQELTAVAIAATALCASEWAGAYLSVEGIPSYLRALELNIRGYKLRTEPAAGSA